ncbi:hypothetical protein VNI00_018074 [Paramarasmius palmivorus]|uniref:Uncharacterized protein n=1 Tax=Paramarasmius palmivorus TaxID=297713 RepID=A0AAW0B0R8_9AGAR
MCSLRLPAFSSLLSDNESSNVLPDSSTVDENIDPCDVSLVQAMPWFTGVVLRDEQRFSMLPVEIHVMATGLLREFHQCCCKPIVREIAGNRTWLSPNQKTAEPLPSLLFGLKMLDICCLIGGSSLEPSRCTVETSSSATPNSVPRTIFQGSTGKLRGIRSLSDRRGWPQSLLSMHALVNTAITYPTRISVNPGELEMSNSQRLALTAIRILESLAEDRSASVLQKAARNMEAAALFINYMLQGYFDFPPTTKVMVSELSRVADRENTSSDIVAKLPSTTILRQALLLALSVSPLILLCDINPLSNSLSRLQMLRAWYHYGSARPAVVRRVEILLWDQLFAISRGLLTSSDALTSFLRSVLPLLPLAKSESNFFNPSLGISGSVPMALSSEERRVSKRFLEMAVANDEHPNETVSRSAATSQVPAESCELSSLLQEDLWKSGESSFNDEQNTTFAVIQCNRPAKESSDIPGDEGDDEMPMSLDSCDTQSRLSTDVRADTCTVNRDSPCLSRRLDEASLKSKVCGEAYLVVSPDGRSCTYWPSFYVSASCSFLKVSFDSEDHTKSIDELDALDHLIRRSNFYQLENGNELHFVQVTAPDICCDTVAEQVSAAVCGSPVLHVTTLTREEYLNLEMYASLSPLFSSGIILVLGVGPAGSNADIDICALSSVGSCSTLRKAIDVSLRERAAGESKCFVFASFAEFMHQVDAGEHGKILYFPSVPDIGSGKEITLSLHTDLYSRRYSLDFAEIKNVELAEDLRWHFVATGNASHSLDMSPDGFDLEFVVELGSILLFLGVDAADPISAATLGDLHFNVGSVLCEMPDTIGLLLLQGDKMYAIVL